MVALMEHLLVWQRGHQVEDEPPRHVVDSNLAALGHHTTIITCRQGSGTFNEGPVCLAYQGSHVAAELTISQPNQPAIARYAQAATTQLTNIGSPEVHPAVKHEQGASCKVQSGDGVCQVRLQEHRQRFASQVLAS
jgi:hypothetical protein